MNWRLTMHSAPTDPHPAQHTLRAAAPGDPPTDREYQIRGVRAITAGLRDGGRGQLRAACGTGKTMMALWAAERLVPRGGVVVIAVPTVGLVAQTLNVWTEQHGSHRALAVCSDTSVLEQNSTRRATNPDHDEFGDLGDITEPVTTDPDMVDAWLRTPCTAAARLIVVTHASCHVVGEGLQKATLTADLLIVDEAHRSAGAVDKHTGLLHDDDVLPAQRRLYMTATPRIGRSRADSDSTYSMDDESVYGPVLFTYPFSEAIADGWLDDYQVAVIGVTEAEALGVLRRGEQDRIPHTGRRITTLQVAMVQTAVARAAAQFGLRRVIAFCPRIDDAKHFAATFPRILENLPEPTRPSRSLTAAHIDGTMSHTQRRKVLRLLQQPPSQGCAVVSNARCLSEGIDVPAVDGIAFTAPKKSPTDIVQAVGRALRRDPNGTGIATIIVPILLADDPAHNAGELDVGFDTGEYEVLWEVVSALRAHDDTFGDALDACRANGFQTQGLLDHFQFLLPESYRAPDVLEHLTVRLVKSATSRWWDGYRALADYRETVGHTLVPAEYTNEDGIGLGGWVSKTRTAYRQGRLGADRIEALEKLEFVYEPLQAIWEANLAAFTGFHTEYGHLHLPEGLTSAYGTDARQALTAYRKQFRQGVLPAERAQALENLGIEWDPHATAAWERILAALRSYHAEHGDVLVPPDFTTGTGVKVAPWLTILRHRKNNGDLTVTQITQLDAVGMVWDTKRLKWERRLKLLRKHVEQHGSLTTTAAEAKTDRAVARVRNIVAEVRGDYHRGTLPAFKIADLEAMGMDWQPDRPSWDTFYPECVRYHAAHGRLRASVNFVTDTGVHLGKWIADQRSKHKQGRLSTHRIEALEALGIEWITDERLDASWKRHLRELDDHCTAVRCTPDTIQRKAKTATGFWIGEWLGRQIKLYRRGGLPTDRANDLIRRGVTLTESVQRPRTLKPASKPKADNWAATLATLQEAHGASKTIDSTTEIGREAVRLLRALRSRHDEGKLTPEQVTKLDALDIEWALPDSKWRIRYLVARRYYRQTGTLIPSAAYRAAQGDALDAWLSYQRRDRKAGRLSADKIDKLDAIGMVWNLDVAAWERVHSAATEFHAAYGHLTVPRDYQYDSIRGERLSLSGFLNRLRSQRRDGKLADERIAAMDALGFEWAPWDTHWDATVAALTKFRNQHGHLLPSYSQELDGVEIGAALYRCRRDHDAGTLAQHRVTVLEELGIMWDPPEVAWRQMIDFLRRYHDEHGNIRVPNGLRAQVTVMMNGSPAPERGVHVADWLVRQRQTREEGRLTDEQITDLDALGMAWEEHADQIARRQQFFAAAHSFFHTHDHLNVPRSSVNKEQNALYHWLRRQRAARTDGTLSEDDIAALDSIGMQWSTSAAKDNAWTTVLEQVKAFHGKHGHFPRSTGHRTDEEHRKLAKWLYHQRYLHAREELRLDRAKMLTDIGYDLSTATNSTDTTPSDVPQPAPSLTPTPHTT